MCTRHWSLLVAAVAALAPPGIWMALRASPVAAPPAPSSAPAGATAVDAAPLAGTAGCSARGCHGRIGPGPEAVRQNEFSLWLGRDKHAQAYEALLGKQGGDIARKVFGEGHTASTEPACLACHTNPHAAAGGSALLKEEQQQGVGCEACHGGAERLAAVAHEPGMEALHARHQGDLRDGAGGRSREVGRDVRGLPHRRPRGRDQGAAAARHEPRHDRGGASAAGVRVRGVPGQLAAALGRGGEEAARGFRGARLGRRPGRFGARRPCGCWPIGPATISGRGRSSRSTIAPPAITIWKPRVGGKSAATTTDRLAHSLGAGGTPPCPGDSTLPLPATSTAWLGRWRRP